MTPIEAARTIAREATALTRNYRHAAILRRHVRAKYGAVVTMGPTVLVGEALAAMDHAPWRRLAILALLLVVAARHR